MIRVCHITSAHAPEDGRIFRRDCVTCSSNGFDTYLVEPGDTYQKNGVSIIGIGSNSHGRLYRMFLFSKKAYLKALDVDADIYHLHDPELLRYALKLKRKGKHVVFDSHENYVEQIKTKPYLPSFVARAISYFYDLYSKHIFKRIDGLTFAGNDLLDSSFNGLCSRVISLDNYPWKNELFDYYNPSIPKNVSTACYIGALTETRGIEQIIKACYSAGFKLYLAGKFSDQTFKYRLENLDEYSCVEYLGQLNRAEIKDLLQTTCVGLCVLQDVGQYHRMLNLPTKVYEYMSMHMPVVLHSSCYNDSIIEKYKFGISVNADDVEDITNALIYLKNNPHVCDAMGQVGRDLVSNYYSWDIEQNKLLSLYNSIIEDK